MEKIKKEDVRIGLKVIHPDHGSDCGIITEISTYHSVYVEFDNGGTGFCCLEENCHDYDPLYYPLKGERAIKLKNLRDATEEKITK